MPSSNFRVIVVGGGPVGLTAAHALSRAGIDFMVLERRSSIITNAGANLVLLPMGMRVLGQLGLLDALDLVSSPLAQVTRLDHSKGNLGSHRFFIHMKENHGRSPRVVGRRDLTKILYESLPPEAQARLHADKKVSDILTTNDGVVVSCADGSSFEGSIVIGADGAHSFTRDRMRSLALQASPASNVNEEKPYLTTFRALWVRFPTMGGLEPGDASETHGYDATLQLFAGVGTTVVGVYEKTASPTRERVRYTRADEDAFVQRWGHLPLTQSLTIRDAYDARSEVAMVNLEEGVVKHWSWDRIVLVGDAAHKFTPSTGAGCNNGIIDIVVLVNQLHRMLEETGAAGSDVVVPSKDQIASAFHKYQDARYDAVTSGCDVAGRATAMASWQTTSVKLIDQYIMPIHRVQKYFMDQAASGVAKAPVLEYVEGEERLKGKVPWAQPIMSKSLVVG